MKINWIRIIGNACFVAVNSMVGMITLSALTELTITIREYFILCSIVAVIQGMAAFFRELTKEAEDDENPPSKLTDNNSTDHPTKYKNKFNGIFKNMIL